MPPLSWSMFEWHSSEIDWCEENYVVTKYIAEFYNTITNIPFFVYPIMCMYLYRKNYSEVTRQGHLVWILFMVTGFWSGYYHATLSLAGQLLDEICIFWLLIASLATWLPERYLPPQLRKRTPACRLCVLLFVILISLLSVVKPAINAIALMTAGIPISYIIFNEVRRLDCPRTKRLGFRLLILWPVALTIWISDRIHCSFWTDINFPYLHSFWHIFIVLAAYQACVLMSYVYATSMKTSQKPVLRYWPRNSSEYLGIPYVVLPSQYTDGFSQANDIYHMV